jgi:DNA-binding NarL/FixJ family response regulator
VLLIDAGSRGVRELCTTLVQDDDPPIVYIALRDDERWAVDALVAGARGILLKSAPPEDLTKAIHVVLNGGVWATHEILVAAWLNQTRQRSKRAPILPIVVPRLTPREMEILRHAATGLGNRELAFTLAITEATVKAHLTSIFQKLGLHGRARLAAAYHGIVNSAPKQLEAKRVPLPAELGRTTFGGVVRRSAN